MQEEPKTLKTDENAPDEPIDEEESNLLDLLIVLLKHKKMIISVVFLAGVLAVYTASRDPISTVRNVPLPQPARREAPGDWRP
jgi:predicted RND superfamily exporter protein